MSPWSVSLITIVNAQRCCHCCHSYPYPTSCTLTSSHVRLASFPSELRVSVYRWLHSSIFVNPAPTTSFGILGEEDGDSYDRQQPKTLSRACYCRCVVDCLNCCSPPNLVTYSSATRRPLDVQGLGFWVLGEGLECRMSLGPEIQGLGGWTINCTRESWIHVDAGTSPC